LIFFNLRKSFYINNIIYYIAAAAAVVFVASYFLPPWFRMGVLILILLGLALVVDTLLIYSIKNGVKAERWLPDRFSMGDDNKIILLVSKSLPFPCKYFCN
jgi:cell division protein FtsW (lipid II flippase)